MRWMGLDFGEKRIGVAVGDDEAGLAHALTVLARHGREPDFKEIGRLAAQQEVTGLVVGLPLNMDGSEGPAALVVRTFARRLAEELKLPVHFFDERLSSWEAEGFLKEAKVRARKRRQQVDKIAAALILQGFLDTNRAKAERLSGGQEEGERA